MTSAMPDGDRSSASIGIEIGPLAVKADRAELQAFLAATPQSPNANTAAELPLTFPMRWLTRDEIRAAVTSLMRGEDSAGLLPLHEAQSFDYQTPLFAEVDYRMRVRIHREHAPAQIVLHADIGPDDDHIHLRLDMVLRIVAIDATGATDVPTAGP